MKNQSFGSIPPSTSSSGRSRPWIWALIGAIVGIVLVGGAVAALLLTSSLSFFKPEVVETPDVQDVVAEEVDEETEEEDEDEQTVSVVSDRTENMKLANTMYQYPEVSMWVPRDWRIKFTGTEAPAEDAESFEVDVYRSMIDEDQYRVGKLRLNPLGDGAGFRCRLPEGAEMDAFYNVTTRVAHAYRVDGRTTYAFTDPVSLRTGEESWKTVCVTLEVDQGSAVIEEDMERVVSLLQPWEASYDEGRNAWLNRGDMYEYIEDVLSPGGEFIEGTDTEPGSHYHDTAIYRRDLQTDDLELIIESTEEILEDAAFRNYLLAYEPNGNILLFQKLECIGDCGPSGLYEYDIVKEEVRDYSDPSYEIRYTRDFSPNKRYTLNRVDAAEGIEILDVATGGILATVEPADDEVFADGLGCLAECPPSAWWDSENVLHYGVFEREDRESVGPFVFKEERTVDPKVTSSPPPGQQ